MAQVAQGNTQQTVPQNADAQGAPQYTPQQIAQANEAYGKATEVQNRLDSQMQAIADKLGIAYTPGVQKSVNSILSRMYRNEMKGRGSDVYALKDLARTHLEMNSWNDVPSVLRALDEMKIPYTVAAKSTPQGYKGLHLTWNDNGIGIELQLSTPEAWKVKMITEEIYAKWREAEADPNFVSTPERDADIARSHELWNQVDFTGFPDSPTISSSSDVSSLESSSQKSPSDMGLVSAPQRPLENSSYGEPAERLTMRPSGLTNNSRNSMVTPPVNSADIIAQNTQNDNSAPRFPSAPTDPNTPAKVSETVTTVRDSLATPEGVKQLINDSIEDGGYHYFPITNDATVESAAAMIREKGYDSVLRDWTADVRKGETGAELAVTGQLLYDAAVKGGL